MLYRYKCVVKDTFYGGKHFFYGDIIEIAGSAPSGFTSTTDEIHTSTNRAYRDLDDTYYFGKGVYGWDDLTFTLDTGRQGVAQKPDYDFTNLGLLFPQNDDTEIAYMTAQFQHCMRSKSVIHPHVHFVQEVEEQPVFKMDYRVYQPGALVPAFTTGVTASEFVFTWVSGDLHQLALFPGIDLVLITGLSALMDVKLYRDDNVVTGDVLSKMYDIHYQRDSLGSGREYQK